VQYGKSPYIIPTTALVCRYKAIFSLW